MAKFWGEKRYYSLDYYLKQTYGEKLYKISLNGGMTCPNRDGTLGEHGCIFCSRGGSGDFASDASLSIREQIAQGKALVEKKHTGNSYIAYFQAYTNTYAPVEYLKRIFSEAIQHPDIAVLSIATRPDCLSGHHCSSCLTEQAKACMGRTGTADCPRGHRAFHPPWLYASCFRKCRIFSAKSGYFRYRPYNSRTSG